VPTQCYFVDTKNTDDELTHHGKVVVHLTGTANYENQVVGSLYAAYKVRLYRRRLPTAIGTYCHVVRSGVTASAPYGTTAVSTQSKGLTVTCNTAGNLLTFPNLVPGDTIMFQAQYVGVSQVVATPTFTFTNFDLQTIQNNYGSGLVLFPGAGTASTNASFGMFLKYTGPPGRTATIGLSTTSIPSSAVMDLFVTVVGTGLANTDF